MKYLSSKLKHPVDPREQDQFELGVCKYAMKPKRFSLPRIPPNTSPEDDFGFRNYILLTPAVRMVGILFCMGDERDIKLL